MAIYEPWDQVLNERDFPSPKPVVNAGGQGLSQYICLADLLKEISGYPLDWLLYLHRWVVQNRLGESHPYCRVVEYEIKRRIQGSRIIVEDLEYEVELHMTLEKIGYEA